MTITDDATGRAVADGMAEAGYGADAIAVMLLDRAPAAPDPALAREIDEPAMLALAGRLTGDDDGIPPADREAVVAGHALVRAALPGTRTFAGVWDGEEVGATTLFLGDGVGQIEAVGTLPAHRGHGVGAAMIDLAGREALAAGCDLVFLLCSVVDGPFALYARLGYRAAGRCWTFNRQA